MENMGRGTERGPHPVSVRSFARGFRPHHPRLRGAVRRVLFAEGFPRGRVSVVFVTDRTMARINRQFTGRTGPTDVLAFDLRGGVPGHEYDDEVAGEVLVSVDRARDQARVARVPLREEIARLVIHGLLHLAGHDHEDAAGRRRMRRREEHWLREEAQGWGWTRK